MDMLFNLPQIDPSVDYNAHNEEVKRVMAAYNAGSPIRVPMILGVNARVLLCDPKYNTRRLSFEEYWNDKKLFVSIRRMDWDMPEVAK